MKKNLLLYLICQCCTFFATAQVTENFADGDFINNPTWSGDVADYTVVSEKLRSNSAVANATFALSTPSTLATSAQWDFTAELQFNTSSTNFVDVWLTASEADLKSTTNAGYFVRIGNTSDEISLYKRVGGTNTILINGTDAVTNFSTNNIRIFVTRDASNLWVLKHAPAGTSTFTTEGSVTDANLTTSAFFGFSIRQSTATFFNKHFFDNIVVQALVVDTQAPTAQTISVTSPNTLRVAFDEAILPDSAQKLTQYSVNNGVGNPSGVTLDGSNAVILTFASNFVGNLLHELTVKNIADMIGNVMPTAVNLPFTYTPSYVPQPRDIVINEIFADETPQVGLPLAEFIELYNASTQVINLQGFVLSDATGSVTLGGYVMQPNSYVILCATAQVSAFQVFGNVLGITLPSLNNTGELLTLKNASGTTIDEVDYKTSWYNDAVKANGGWTLEQINPTTPCTGASNWTASTNTNGGTPGIVNSVFSTAPDLTAPQITSVVTLSNTQIQLFFSEKMDTVSLNSGVYNISGGITVSAAKAGFPEYKSVLLTFAAPITDGLLYTVSASGVKDCVGNNIAANTNEFGKGAKPNYNDLVISEIFADETPQVGLPLGEFIEITNRSSKIIDLSNISVTDTTSGGKLPANAVLFPNEKAIVCGTTAAAQYAAIGRTFGITSFPSLSNTGETLLLRNSDGSLIFSVTYSDTWYQDEIKKQGGWTLEMIDVQNPCGGASNWTASTNTNGGTPAQTNSVNANNNDAAAPQISSVQVVGNNLLVVTFNEILDSLSAINVNNYQINGGITVSAVTIRRFFYNRVYLTFSGTLTNGQFYELTATGVKDCAANTQATNATFGKGAKPNYNDLVISEIFADETPQVGLPLGEFIEITNRSSKIIDLSNISVTDTTSGGKLPANAVLFPNEKVIVCGTTAAPQYAAIGKTFGITSFPSLSNTGETLLLRNTDGSLIFSVTYSDTWYQDEIKKQGGWTLEMIDVQNPCGGASNWIASNNVNGGTPAQTNSVNATNTDVSAPQIASVITLSSNLLMITFNETLDSLNAINSSNYQISGGITVNAASMKRFFYNRVYLNISGTLVEGQLYTLTSTGVADCAGNAQITTANFGKGAKPNYNDLVISEIFADETPQVGLPLGEFIEITNRSSKIIDVSNLSVTDTTSGGRLPINTVLYPNEKVTVCGTTAAPQYAPIGRTFGISNFPSLSNTGETLLLRRSDGTLVFSVTYSDAWYQDELKKQGGWTLEMKDVQNPCGGASNWTASNNVNGGTPAQTNSVDAINSDVTAPQITLVQTLSDNLLLVIFNETIDSLNAINVNHYQIDGGITVNSAMVRKFYYDRVYLNISGTLNEGQFYTLTATGITDCASNAQTSSASFGKGVKAQYNDLVISEIFADETPEIGLPPAEFIEITNRSNKIIDLSGVSVSDTSNGGRLPANNVILPNEKIIVCGTTAAPQYAALGKTFGISNFPSLSNSGETLLLRNANGTLIFAVTYSDTWYNDEVKQGGGWTLEMKDVQNPCGGASNWAASTNTSGGTPAQTNSVAQTINDATAPQIVGVQALNTNLLLVTFSETVDSLNAINAIHYQIDGGITVASVAMRRFFYDRVYVSVNENLAEGRIYTLTTTGITDCAGNSQTSTANFGKGRKPNYQDLLITEIFADETPQVGLPEYEFVEIYNNTDFTIDLSGCTFSDATTRTKFPAVSLLPRQYLIVCGTAAKPAYSTFGETVSITLPTLNSTDDVLTIRGENGKLIHSVAYNDDWYGQVGKAEGGWTLEMVDVNNPCGGASNWRASESNTGGTPGKVNSVAASNPDVAAPQIARADVLDEFTVRVQLNEVLDSAYALSSSVNFSIDNNASITQVSIEALKFDVLNIRLAAPLEYNKIYTLTATGLRDCAGNLSVSTNITFVRPQPADTSDVLLNEVLFNPLTGGVDFVEFYNRSSKFIDLKGWSLANWDNGAVANIKTITQTFILKPAQYLAISTDKMLTKRDYPKVQDENMLEIPSLPAYNDGDGVVIILNPQGKVVQRLDYTDKFHFGLLDDVNGVSLERISFDAPVNQQSSWQSAAEQAGYGTPGQPNSQRINNLTSDGAITIEPQAFTPDSDGDRDFTTIRYKFNSGGASVHLNIYDDMGRLVKRLAQNQLLASEGFYTWDGTDDSGKKARIGLYMVYMEVLELGGKKSTYKKPVAIGAKF